MIMLIRAFPPPLNDLYEWRPGDCITYLDDRPVEDMLDLYYYTPDDDVTTLTIKRTNGERITCELDPSDIDIVTGCFAPLEFKTCACQCVFCFIDQNPAGMRDQIYVKDEDYRFSFLYGNYITLTSLGKKGLARIIEQKMSPLFVSVHATDIEVRTRMLGIKRRIDVVDLLRQLTAAGVEVHTQVVLCPGWNDGDILDRTIAELSELATSWQDDGDVFADPDSDPVGAVRSLAIVPVGLSAHREGLTRLDPVTPEIAGRAIDQVAARQARLAEDLGYSFAYLSDEFYLLADRPFPPVSTYDGFWQVDNAIGLTPRLKEMWSEAIDWARQEGPLPTRPLTVLTGELAAGAWAREFTPLLEASGLPPVQVIGVENTFYGLTVTVAGLLSGADLRRALLTLPPDPVRTVVLSPRVFNSDGLTLDGLDLDALAADQPHEVLVAEEEAFIDFWADLD